MKRGQGKLTYKQLEDSNIRLQKENAKLRAELHAMTIAHNKPLKKAKEVHT